MKQDSWNLDDLLRIPKTFEIGEGYRCEITAVRAEKTLVRPHGIRYNLTMYDPAGEELLCFDNRSAIYEKKSSRQPRLESFEYEIHGALAVYYEYASTADLIEDFFDGVERILIERGVRR
ncbi:hypothetical protein ACQZV8_02765 [Magnetococcales bacterium HHB-1]